ncbi:diadenosine tetraphosphate (Ap4A) HIT family hydrolase [Elusimicrobium simillimum]|uniref:HIT family protein n=1 Tax=Elusimicrobium simillimum TaxID=3143438 RepID=UPI003C6F2134
MKEKSPASQCLYCQRNQTQKDLMIDICDLDVSRVFLFKEQTYKGRCLVAHKEHTDELFELSDEQRDAFMKDVARVCKAMSVALGAEKINMGAYSDKLSHLHFHLVPKYIGGPDYPGIFQMNPQKVYLTDEENQELIAKIKANL